MALLQIIEWSGSPDTIVYKYSARENAVERGSRLVVREGQAAIFCDRGKLADVFGPGTYSLDARTIPILTRIGYLFYKYRAFFCAQMGYRHSSYGEG